MRRLADQLKWSNSAFLIRSPVVRLAAAVPMLGYVVLYGDAFADLFDFTDSLGGEYLLFNAQLKARLVYYGSILIALALLIYRCRCPAICRRLNSKHDARDEYSRIGTIRDLLMNPLANSGFNSRVTHDALAQYVSSVVFLTTSLINSMSPEQKGRFYRRTLQGPTYDNVEHSETAYLSAWLAEQEAFAFEETPPKTWNELVEYQRSFYPYYLHALTFHFHFTETSRKIRDRAADVYVTRYGIFNTANVLSQILVFLLSSIGVLLAFLPALDVLLQVALTDLGIIGEPASDPGLASESCPADQQEPSDTDCTE